MTLHGTNKVFCLVLKYHFPFYPRPDSRVGTEAGANEGFATKTHGEISPEKHKFPRPFFSGPSWYKIIIGIWETKEKTKK